MSAPGSEQPPPAGRDRPQVRVHPGAGVIDRHGDILLVVPVLPAGAYEWVRELISVVHRPDGTGPSRTAAVRTLLDRPTAAEPPGFALLVGTGGALRVLVHGPIRIVVDGRAQQPPVPGAGERLAEHVLQDGAWHDVRVTADDGTTDDDPALPAAADALPLDLDSGTVPGAGVTVARVPAAAAAAVATSLTALRPSVQFRTILLGECALRAAGASAPARPVRPPLPLAGTPEAGVPGTGTTGPEVLVEGVLCPDGHFTDPDRSACTTCGTTLPPGGRRVIGPRPPLGILVTDGGTIYTVTGDFVIGREADAAPDVRAGQARPLPLRDEARSTSRVHARLTIRGWTVLLSDNSSANGTFVSRHGAAGPWLPVPPQAPLPLLHGDRVRLGKRQLLFDAWRETVVPEVFR